MAATNTLTAIAPTLYSAAQQVSQEPAGALDSINFGFDNKGVARGDNIKVPVAPVRAGQDFTPAATSTAGLGATASAVEVEISKSRKVSFNLRGEQIRSLENAGNDQEWIRQLIAQGMRTLINEAESDLVEVLYKGASRAVGTAGTTPFASDLSALNLVHRELKVNGSPMSDLQFVMNPDAEYNLRNLGIVQQAFAAGTSEQLRRGVLLQHLGFDMRSSAQIDEHDSATAASYELDVTTSIPVGTTALVVDTGTAGINVGDVFSIASGDGSKYVVQARSPATNVTSITIARPGTRSTYLDDAVLTFTADYTPNIGFERDAVVGIARPPIVPANPTIQQMPISAPNGLSFLLLDIAQYGMRTWELHLAWGFSVVQPEHVITLLG